MPYWKCNSCHHEWEGIKSKNKCEWCGSEGHILEEKTPFEQTVESIDRFLRKVNNYEKNK